MRKERLLWTGRIHFHDCRQPQRFAVVNNRRGEKKKTSECKWRFMFAVNVQTLSWHRKDASGIPRESLLGVVWQKGEAFGP